MASAPRLHFREFSFSIVLGIAAGLMRPENLLSVNMDTFEVSGIITDGINSMMDMAIFVILMMPIVHLPEEGGFFAYPVEKLQPLADTET